MGGTGGDLLWTRALAVAESMEERGSTLKDIDGLLCGLEEGFRGAADPVEDFPAYVTVRLCRSMALVLQRIEQQRP